MFQLLANSEPFYIALTLISGAVGIIVPIICIIISLKGFSLYVKDKMDGQILSILAFSINFLIISLIGSIIVFSGYYSSKLSYINIIVIFLLTIFLINSRLMAFPCIFFHKKVRILLYAIFNILTIANIVVTLYFFKFSPNIHFSEFNFYTLLNIYNHIFNLEATLKFSIFNITLLWPVLSNIGFIFFFDIKEKRSKKTLKTDILLLGAPTFIFIYSVFNNQILFYFAPILFISLYFFILIIVWNNYKSILYRSSSIFITLESYKDLIQKIARNDASILKNKEYIINSISKMIDDNNEIKEHLFDINWNRREKIIINKIKELCHYNDETECIV